MLRAHYASADRQYKVILVGDSGVGKTTMLRTLVREPQPTHVDSTIGVDFCYSVHRIHPRGAARVDHKHVKLQIWDTAGQERFRSLTSAYYAQANAVVMVYDTTDLASAQHLESFYQDIRRELRGSSWCDLVWHIVGTKVDLMTTPDEHVVDTIQALIERISAEPSPGCDECSNDDDDATSRPNENPATTSVTSSSVYSDVDLDREDEPRPRIFASTMNAHNAPMVMGTYDRIAYELYDQEHDALSATDQHSSSGTTGKTVLMADRLRTDTCAEGGLRRGGCSA